jgi:hypothetical protein
MATYSGYITEVRRLLHDAAGNFWTDTELADYINAARERVVRDTGCLRTLQVTSTPISNSGVVASNWVEASTVSAGEFVFSNIFVYEVINSGTLGTTPNYPNSTNAYPPTSTFTTTGGTAVLKYNSPAEIINLSALPQANQTIDVLNINLFWGNTRIPLRYLAWSDFNAQLRFWQNYTGRPVCFSMYGQGQIYIAPIPDQSYAIEIDTVILPLPLTSNSSVETILDPYTTPVAYYAAHTAKYKEQSYGEAEIFKAQYDQKVRAALTSTMTRRLPTPYSTPY